jgi:Carboxypeptidase regulatory-like domain
MMRVANRAEFAPSSKRIFRIIGGFLLLALLLVPGWAQQSELRTVRGAVLDKAENPVASAVVYLKNVRTMAVKTYISDRAGEYRFSGLDPNVDYEVHAESESLTSNTRTVSSFDSRKDIVISLKLDKEKKKT